MQILLTGVSVLGLGVPLPVPRDDDDVDPGLLGKVRSSDLAGPFLLLLVPCLVILSTFAFFPGIW